MPALRSSSDIAWAIWNRASSYYETDLKDIRKVMSLTVVKDETELIAREALRRQSPTIDSVQPWPGTDFLTSTEEGVTLLGM
jgi:hypothetical protein